MANIPADLVTAARQFETGDAATIQLLGALADALAAQTIAVLQAQHERDCAVEKLAELRNALMTVRNRIAYLAENSRFTVSSEKWQLGQDMKVTLHVIDSALPDTRG